MKEKDDNDEAVRRLRNAEASLRDAIQEVQKKQKQHEGQCPLCNHPDSCMANAIGNLCQSFLLAYGFRVGIGILLRAFNLAKGQSYRSILDLKVS